MNIVVVEDLVSKGMSSQNPAKRHKSDRMKKYPGMGSFLMTYLILLWINIGERMGIVQSEQLSDVD